MHYQCVNACIKN